MELECEPRSDSKAQLWTTILYHLQLGTILRQYCHFAGGGIEAYRKFPVMSLVPCTLPGKVHNKYLLNWINCPRQGTGSKPRPISFREIPFWCLSWQFTVASPQQMMKSKVSQKLLGRENMWLKWYCSWCVTSPLREKHEVQATQSPLATSFLREFQSFRRGHK